MAKPSKDLVGMGLQFACWLAVFLVMTMISIPAVCFMVDLRYLWLVGGAIVAGLLLAGWHAWDRGEVLDLVLLVRRACCWTVIVGLIMTYTITVNVSSSLCPLLLNLSVELSLLRSPSGEQAPISSCGSRLRGLSVKPWQRQGVPSYTSRHGRPPPGHVSRQGGRGEVTAW